MNKVVFAGCSFTAGTGWPDAQNSSNLWCVLCHQHIPVLQNLEHVNIGQAGASNQDIFENIINSISHHGSSIKYLFCQWTAAHRYNFNVGFELWHTSESLQETPTHPDINLSDITYRRKYLEDIKTQFKTLHHIHYEIVKVIRYSKIISNLASQFGIKCIHINGICPWDENYFNELTGPHVRPEDYTTFTKNQIINISNRTDKDIFELYAKAHQDYRNAGSIDPGEWVNLYRSQWNSRIDFNFDKAHPGAKSNQVYFDWVKDFLNTH